MFKVFEKNSNFVVATGHYASDLKVRMSVFCIQWTSVSVVAVVEI